MSPVAHFGHDFEVVPDFFETRAKSVEGLTDCGHDFGAFPYSGREFTPTPEDKALVRP